MQKRRRTEETGSVDDPSSLFYYDRIMEDIHRLVKDGGEVDHNSTITRIETQSDGGDLQQSSAVVRVTRRLNGNSEGEEIMRLINVPSMIGFSRLSTRSIRSSLFTTAKAVMMAQYHFNDRLETVVPNLREILTDKETGEECDLRMGIDFYDTGLAVGHAMQLLSEELHKRGVPYEASAVMGAVRSAVSIPLAVVNSVRKVPQVSYASTSTTLDNRDTYPMFGRVIPSNEGDAKAVMDYYRGVGVTHLGILYVRDAYGSAFRAALEESAASYGIETRIATIPGFGSEGGNDIEAAVASAVKGLRATGYRYFIGVIFGPHFKPLVRAATKAGIMGRGHHWIFADGINEDAMTGLSAKAGTPLAEAIHGLGLLSTGSALSSGHFDRFVEAFDEFENRTDFRDYFASKTPIASDLVTFQRNQTFYKPSQFPPLAYDAIMTLGIAACNAKNPFFSGEDLFDQFLQVNFEGASGTVRINEKTGARYHNTTPYYIANGIVTEPDENGNVTLKVVPALEYSATSNGEGSTQARWRSYNGTKYNYSDFTFTPPLSLPEIELNQNEIPVGLFATGMALSCVIMLSAIGFAIWTWLNRKSRVVRASQPGFLIAICIGVFLMASAIIFLSTDTPPFSFEFSNFSCMASYWVFCMGFGLAYSALFAKTWRINKILSCENHFRRIVVEPKDVILPGVCILLLNFIILMVWQFTSPLVYKRDFDISRSVDIYGRPNESQGTCTAEDGSASEVWFMIAIFAVNGSAVIAANVQAFRARKITTEFSESRYIGVANAILLQTLLIALPVFFYRTGAVANYLAKAVILLVVSGSMLYLIMVPKVLIWRQHQKDVEERRIRRQERLSRLSNIHGTGNGPCPGGNAVATLSQDFIPEPIAEETFSQETEGRESLSDEAGVKVMDVKPTCTFSAVRRNPNDVTSGVRIISHHSRRSSHGSRSSSLQGDSFYESSAGLTPIAPLPEESEPHEEGDSQNPADEAEGYEPDTTISCNSDSPANSQR